MSDLAHTRSGRASTRGLLSYLAAALLLGSLLTLLLLGTGVPLTRIKLILILYALSALLTVFVVRAYQRQLGELKAMRNALAQHSSLLEKNTQLLERAQSLANVGSWVSDMAAGEITPSPHACKILGMPAGQRLRYRDYLARVHQSDRPGMAHAWRTARTTGMYDGEHRVLVEGSWRWVRQRAELAFAADGRPLGALGVVQDITVHKAMQLALKASKDRYRTLIDWTPEAILVHRHTHILYANPAALKLFAAPDVPSLLCKRTTDLIHPSNLNAQLSRLSSIEKGEPLSPSTEARFLTLDGSPIDVEVQGTAIEFDGEPAVQVSIRDITERKRMENEIRQLAFYDSLTALPNRRLLDDRLQQAMSANRRSGHFGALMFLDLDHFKPLNDLYGHALGDLLLVEAAARLTACVREMDTVARFGGDEFVVLLAELDTDGQQARHVAETVAQKIKSAMTSPYSLALPNRHDAAQRIEHRCTASIGVAVFASASADAQELTKWADAAMYQAKNEGRNRICFIEHGTDEIASNHLIDSGSPSLDEV